MEIKHFNSDEEVRDIIQECQSGNHLHQVEFSTYHDCLTQVCFTCSKVRTSLNDWKDAKKGCGEEYDYNDSYGKGFICGRNDNLCPKCQETYSPQNKAIKSVAFSDKQNKTIGLTDTKSLRESESGDTNQDLCECGHTKVVHQCKDDACAYCDCKKYSNHLKSVTIEDEIKHELQKDYAEPSKTDEVKG